MSKPVRLAVQEGLLIPGMSVLDYGCGHGEDVRRLNALGITTIGWDPVFHPQGTKGSAQAVNLGYVVNVIESREERASVLASAWSLAERFLMVSARSTLEDAPDEAAQPHGDGVLTRLGSFQKFYDQHELREWIQEVLGVEPLPAGPGIFFVFKDEALRETWRSHRYRSRVAQPKIPSRERLFREHRELLDKLMAFLSERGRLPQATEVLFSDEVHRVFGSFNRALQVIRTVTGDAPWLAIRDKRKEDLLVWLALCRFQVRPNFSVLPKFLQWDVKAFYGAYSKACNEADSLLFSIGDPATRETAIRRAPFGKLMPKGLYVHADYLEDLPPVLRLYEGCARALIGGVLGANVIKFHLDAAQVSYLTYPDFDKDPHPELADTIVVGLENRWIRRRSYSEDSNRFILHRKETFLPKSAPNWERFHRLTNQEEQRGLYETPATIGTRKGWESLLASCNLKLIGHRLVKSNPNPVENIRL